MSELSREQIEQVRACLNDGTYTPLECKDFGVLCDMALRALSQPLDESIRELAIKFLRKYRIEEATEIVRQLKAHFTKPDSEAVRLHAINCEISERLGPNCTCGAGQPAAREPVVYLQENSPGKWSQVAAEFNHDADVIAFVPITAAREPEGQLDFVQALKIAEGVLEGLEELRRERDQEIRRMLTGEPAIQSNPYLKAIEAWRRSR